MPGVAALFDIDHTLIHGGSGPLFVRYLVAQGRLRRRDLLGPAYYTLLHRLNLLDMNTVFRRYSSWARGEAHDEMRHLCAEWYAAVVRPQIHGRMAAQVREHRRAGHRTAILSSATVYVAELLAAELGIDHIMANRLVVKDGHLTGEVVEPLCWGPGKRYWAERFAAEQGVDLARSYFYSDSGSDLPVLDVVGHPRAVNPDRMLRRLARQRGWPVYWLEIEPMTAEPLERIAA